MFEIDADLRILVVRLCEAELQALGLSTLAVTAGVGGKRAGGRTN